MNFISVDFFAFLPILIIIYYLFPSKWQWLLLLAGSVFFYYQGNPEHIIFLLSAAGITYGGSLWINSIYNREEKAILERMGNEETGDILQKKNDIKKLRRDAYSKAKKKTKYILWGGVTLLLAMLFYSKAGERILESISSLIQGNSFSMKIIVPLGISYYSFAAIGYLADVYWKKDIAEKNPLKLMLYLMFFPQITQGPIPRHNKLAPQLLEGHKFDYQNLCFGFQRILWGYFKKMVIADRFAVIVRNVFYNYNQYEGLVFVIAAVASAIQLYTDFSGCMDIAIGIAQTLGIKLEENFKRPFFSRTAAEFWRRWHITLGAWFKDYVYMPLVVSPSLMKLSNSCRELFGKRFAKSILSVIPLAVVWFLTGLWHGTGKNYIAWGVWWGGIIILSTVFAPELKKLTQLLRFNTDSDLWHVFQMVRTFVIFCIGRLLTAPRNLRQSADIFLLIGKRFNPWILFDGTVYRLGLDRLDFWIGVLSVLLLWYIERQQEKGTCIRQKVASAPVLFRWMAYYALFFAVAIFGVYGSGHAVAGFVYANY